MLIPTPAEAIEQVGELGKVAPAVLGIVIVVLVVAAAFWGDEKIAVAREKRAVAREKRAVELALRERGKKG